MRQRVLFTILLLILLMAVAPMTGAQEDRLQIVGSHSILTDVITNVASDVADVTSVMPRGADPHSFQPTPSDLTALADADVVFINGMDRFFGQPGKHQIAPNMAQMVSNKPV